MTYPYYMIRKYLSFALLFIVIASEAHYPIIYLISPPRSLSVAFMRIMHATKLFTIFHEPSQYLYSAQRNPFTAQDFFIPSAYTSYQEIKESIFKAAETSPVFVKEESYAVKDFLITDKDFISNPDIQFVLLIRNPHHSALSLYRKMPIMPHYLKDLLGYDAAFLIFKELQKYATRPPLIIFSEDLYKRTESTIKAFCKQINIPFTREILSWEELGDNFTGQQEWAEQKQPELTHYWHSDAIQSTHIHIPQTYGIDSAGNPTCKEVALEHRLLFKKNYEYHKEYYDKLCKEYTFHLKI